MAGDRSREAESSEEPSGEMVGWGSLSELVKMGV